MSVDLFSVIIEVTCIVAGVLLGILAMFLHHIFSAARAFLQVDKGRAVSRWEVCFYILVAIGEEVRERIRAWMK